MTYTGPSAHPWNGISGAVSLATAHSAMVSVQAALAAAQSALTGAIAASAFQGLGAQLGWDPRVATAVTSARYAALSLATVIAEIVASSQTSTTGVGRPDAPLAALAAVERAAAGGDPQAVAAAVGAATAAVSTWAAPLG